MFMSTKRILLKKGDFFQKYVLFEKTGNFLKRGEFFKKEGILGEKDVIFQNYGFFERGIFKNVRNFL